MVKIWLKSVEAVHKKLKIKKRKEGKNITSRVWFPFTEFVIKIFGSPVVISSRKLAPPQPSHLYMKLCVFMIDIEDSCSSL